MIKERRKHARLRIPIEAEYRVADEDVWRQGTIWTLGAGGAALLCDEKLATGAVLESLHFVVEAEDDLPETRIQVSAEVVYVDREAEFGCRSCFVLGLRFRDLGDAELELLRQFVFRRLTAGQRPAAEAEPGDTTGAPPLEIRFKLFEEFVDEVSENLSLSGMFIRAHRPLPPGSKFAFRFQLGEDFSLFQGTAEVVWTRRRSEGPERPPGMGVRFLKLDLTSQKMVRRLVDQREAERAAARAPGARPEAPAGGNADEIAAPAAPQAEPDEPAAQDAAAAEPVALLAAEAAGDETRERLTRLAIEADALRDELVTERAARAAAEDARERAESAAVELRADLERLAVRVEDAESELELLRRESAEARREAEALEAELRVQLERQVAERADLEDRLAQAGEAAADLRQQVGDLEDQVARGAKIEAALREQARELRAEPAELEARLERASERLRRLRGAAAGMTSDDLDAARSLGDELAQRLAEVVAAGASLEEKIGSVGAARAGLADLLTRLAESWSELQHRVAADGEDLDVDEPPAGEAEAPAEALRDAASVEAGEPGKPLEGFVPEPAGLQSARLEPAGAETARPQPAAAEPVAAEPDPAGPMAEPAGPAPSASDPEVEPEAAGSGEPSAAARLVGAARRAAARLGLAQAAPALGNGSAGGNGSAAQPVVTLPENGGEAAAPASGGGDDPEAIEETVRAWAAAWSEQRVEDYLSFYSRDFEPVPAAASGGDAETPPAWLPPLAGMELTLGPISHTELAPGRCAVQFEQRVASDSYVRRTGRTLELVRESDAWKIAAESFQEL